MLSLSLTKNIGFLNQLNTYIFCCYTNGQVIRGSYIKQALIIISALRLSLLLYTVVRPRDIVGEHGNEVRPSKGIHAFIMSISEQRLGSSDLP